MGPSRAGPTAPGPARVRPHRVIFSNHGPSPTWAVRFQSHATSARPGQRVSNLTGRLPGLAREIVRIFNIFALSSCCVPSRFRGSNVLVTSRPAASLGSRSLSYIQSAYEAVCHAPMPAFGYSWCGMGLRSALIRHTSSHEKRSRIVILFF